MSNAHIDETLNQSGFALVIALGLMSFILLLLLGITAFVNVESRVAEQSLRHLEARLNAILAMQIALGELQTVAGPDQRITATADLLAETDSSRQHLLGVWSSDPANTTHLGQRLRWLASDSQSANAHESPVTGEAVLLVADGSVGSATDHHVSVGINDTFVRNQNGNAGGHYGWWVGDVGVQARINLPEPEADSPVQRRLRDRLHRSAFARSSLAGFEAPFNSMDASDDRLANVFTWAGAELLYGNGFDPEAVAEQYHQLGFWSKGVLANVRDGGLKRDLSMAFEMSDGDFANSRFAGAGANRINAPTVGWIEPLFIHEGSHGPAWHLLRDYASIYQRMEAVMARAEFPAQSHFPNVNDMGLSGRPAWLNSPANLFSGGYGGAGSRLTFTEGISGDPLRAAGSLPLPTRANYAPYLQRQITEMAIGFEPTSPANPGDPEERYVRLLVRPQYVMHNPYNVRLRHQEMFTMVDLLRFRIRVVPEGSSSDVAPLSFTEGNWSMLKIPAGVMEPGEIRIFEGLAIDDLRWSNAGPRLDYFLPSGGRGPYVYTQAAGGERLRIPPGNVQIFYHPLVFHGMEYWDYRLTNHMTAPADGNPPIENQTGPQLRDAGAMSKVNSMMRTGIPARVSEWYGGSDEDGIVINTEDFRDLDGDPPRPFLIFDAFLKPAGYNSPFVGSSLRYPAFTHTNPLAPVLLGRNLLPLDLDHDSVGYPVMSPDWQVEISGLSPTGGLPIQFDTFNNRAYWGSSHFSGTTAVSMIELPTGPVQSIGQLQNANISLLGFMPALAIGNSFASPYITRNRLIQSFNNEQGNERVLYDISYLANEALWDGYYFSSLSRPYQVAADRYAGTVGDQFNAVFIDSTQSHLPNARMRLNLSSGETVEQVRSKWIAGSGDPRATAYRRTAENLMLAGAFNIHSTSEAAWRAVLSGARDMTVDILTSAGINSQDLSERTPMGRLNPANASSFNGGSIDNSEAWQGFRALTDAQITSLAEAIVAELRERVQTQGNRPFLSMAEYVNRRLSNDRFGLAGLLQAAIERSGINNIGFQNSAYRISATTLSSGMGAGVGSFPAPDNILQYDGADRSSASGAAANINQADLLQVIGSFITPRSDTFIIRAYGDSRSTLNSSVLSRVWCELVVQRIPEPLIPAANDPADENFWLPEALAHGVGNSVDNPFGYARKFRIVSFRWLSEDEI